MNTNDRLLKYPKEFIQGLSEFYPLSESLLTEAEFVWDWHLISRNTTIEWDEYLLQQFHDHFNWHELSKNSGIPFSEDLLLQFRDRWHWPVLVQQKAIVNDPKMLEICISSLSVRDRNSIYDDTMAALEPTATWAAEFFANDPDLDWEAFSSYKGFNWTPEFIRKHADKFDWEELSLNEGIPFTVDLLREFSGEWDWFNLSFNNAIPWNIDYLDAFEKHIDWRSISSPRSKIDWTVDMLIRFKEKLEWVYLSMGPGSIEEIEGLYNHKNIQWTPALYEALHPTISKFFEQLAEEEAEALEESDRVLVNDTVHWTCHMDGINWSEPFFEMLVKMSETNPGINFINWKDIGYYFSHWTEWSKKSIDLLIERTAPGSLVANHCFPVNDHPVILNKLYNNEFSYDWDGVSQRPDIVFTDAFLERNLDNRWYWFSTNANIPVEILRKYKDRFYWDNIFRRNNGFAPEMIDAFPEEWARTKRGRKVFQPFTSLAEMAAILFPQQPAGQHPEQLITEALVADFAERIQSQPISVIREDLEKALQYNAMEQLLLNVQHNCYWPMLFGYTEKICSAEKSGHFVAQLGKKALQFLTEHDFEQSIALYKLILQIEISSNERDLSIYCNALYAIQNDNSGLGVDADLNRQFLEKCMPWAPKNPGIYFNAACLYMEMNELDNVYECIRLSKEYGFTGYDDMMDAINTAEMFAPFRQDIRFGNLL